MEDRSQREWGHVVLDPWTEDSWTHPAETRRSPWGPNNPPLPVCSKAWLFSISWSPHKHDGDSLATRKAGKLPNSRESAGRNHVSLSFHWDHRLKNQRALPWANSQLQVSVLSPQQEVKSQPCRTSYPARSLALASCPLANFCQACSSSTGVGWGTLNQLFPAWPSWLRKLTSHQFDCQTQRCLLR